MSDDSNLSDSSEIPAKKPKIHSKNKKETGVQKKKARGVSQDEVDNVQEVAKSSKNSKELATPSSDIESSEDELEKDDGKSSVKGERDHQGNEIIPIGGNRFVSVDRFKGRLLVGLREYYQKDGKWFPGKKGISLNQDQYHAFLKVLPDIKKKIGSS